MRHRLVTAVAATTLIVSSLQNPGFAAAAPAFHPATPQRFPAIPLTRAKERVPAPVTEQTAKLAHREALPPATATVVALVADRTTSAARSWHRVGSSGVSLAPAGRLVTDHTVSISTLTAADARRAGFSGPVLRLARTDHAAGTLPVKVGLDAGLLDSLYGAGYAAHVRWLSAPVSAPRSRQPVAASGTNAVMMNLGRTPMLLAASASPVAANGSGSFAATSLKPTSSWQVSAQTGGFAWSNPLRVPPAAAGPAPSLALSYNSQAVDGETGATNNQPSDEGDGWSLQGTGSIERSFTSCGADDGASGRHTGTGSADLCWTNDNATLSFGSHSGQILPSSAHPGTFVLSDDDGSRLQHLTLSSGSNGTWDKDYWVLTTTDGTQYFFGRGGLPGSGWSATNSAWTVPVFGNDAGEPCHAATFAASSCLQAWRWNLDYVVDRSGNAEALFYTPQLNHFASNGSPFVVYTRGGYLTQIAYGLRDGAAYTTTSASDKVIVVNAARCDTSVTGDNPSTACNPNSPTTADWPDTPWYLNCTASPCTQTSPSFFSTTMVQSVYTVALIAGAYPTIDTWNLTHTFPSPGAGEINGLWLSKLDHVGSKAGSGTFGPASVADPTVVFHSTSLNNRVVKTDTLTYLPKLRVSSIDTATGGTITVNYAAPECTSAMLAGLSANPQANTHLCYPQWWTPPLTPAVAAQLDWFNKYLVTDVEQSDNTGPSPVELETDYKYLGTPAWRFDTAPATPDGQRSWTDFAGYGQVEVREGNSNAPALQHTTDYTFYRGLDADPNGPISNPTSSVRTAYVSGAIPDDRWLAGRTYETITRVGSSGATVPSATPVVADSVTLPWASGSTGSLETSYTYTDPNDASKTYTADFTLRAHLTGDGTVTTSAPRSDGSTRITHTTTSGYDSYGRPGQVERQTPDAGTTCTTTSYATNATTWLIDYPAEVIVTGKACGAALTYPDDAIADTQSFYDGYTASAGAHAADGQAPTLGNLTETRIVNGYPGNTAASAQWVVSARTLKTDYDTLGRRLKVTDQLSRVASVAYQPAAAGPLTTTTTTNPLSWTTNTTQNPAWGVPISSTDINGKLTTETYDALGRAAQLWTPDWTQAAHSTTPRIAYGYTTSAIKPDVVSTTAVIATGATATSYAFYDGLGRPIQTQVPAETGGADVVDTSYDGQGQVSTVSAFYWVTTAPSTTLATHTLVLPSQTRTTYDGDGRPTASILLGNGTEVYRSSTSYLGVDRVDVTPPTGGTPTTTYTDSKGQVTALVQYLADTPTGSAAQERTQYSYDARGDRISMTDPAGDVWRWHYDAMGRADSATDPDTGTTATSYDLAGRVTKTVDTARTTSIGTPAASVTLAYDYDLLDRRTNEYLNSTSGTKILNYTYDGTYGTGSTAYTVKGALASSTRWDGGTAYATTVTGYDAGNRVLGQTLVVPGSGGLAGSYTTSFTYASDGSLKSLADPAAGGLPAETLRLGYDSYGGVSSYGSSLTSAATSISYTNLGQLAQVMQTQDAQTVRTNTWDAVTGRLKEVLEQRNATANAVVSDDTYSYNDAGQVTADTNTTAAAGTDTQCFRYDHLQQLTQAWTPSSNSCTADPGTSTAFGGPAPYWQSWTNDPATGNRLTTTAHSVTGTGTDTQVAYTYNPSQPHTIDGTTTGTAPAGGTSFTPTGTSDYSYDGDGDLIARPGQQLSYTPDGHLQAVKAGSATGGNNVYNADGNLLIQRSPDGSSTMFLGDTDMHLAAGASVASATRTYSAVGLSLAERTTQAGVAGSKLFFLDPNIDGTVVATVDDATAAVSRRYQDPYGNPRGTPAGWIDSHSFLGQQLDPASGITHMSARDYDTVTGTFLTADPVLDPGDPLQNNGYCYAHSNPITTSDPSGLHNDDPTSYGKNGNDYNADVPPPGASTTDLCLAVNGGDTGACNHTGPTPTYDPRANRRAAIHVDKDSDPFQTWYIGATNDGFTGSAQVTDGNGNTICLGQGACQAAMHYISKHPHDFTTALDLAANYCIDHPDTCHSYDNNRAISDDLLNLGMALAAGTYTATSDITAADTATTVVGRKGVTKAFDDGSSARYGGEIKIQPGANGPGEVNGVQYSGHAFDQMQGRGITPSAVDDVIQSGTASVGADGSTVYYSSANDLSVVANSNGRIITVGYGQFKPR